MRHGTSLYGIGIVLGERGLFRPYIISKLSKNEMTQKRYYARNGALPVTKTLR